MKRATFLLLALQLSITSCTSSQYVADNTVLKDHQPPFTVFAIGYWTNGYNILTLTDANHEYMVIKIKQNTAIKIGDTYRPEIDR
jgi:hypothetical protein